MFLCGKDFSLLYCLVLLCSLATLSAIQATSQTLAFTPAADDHVVLQTLDNQIEDLYKKEVMALPAQNRKEMAELLKLRHDNIQSKFDRKEIYTSALPTAYLQKIVQEILRHNPLLQNKTINCYFSRSAIPNASYVGEGMIVFNMGLFIKLHNESQAAFIICHELAHEYLHHSENSIRNYVTTMNSDEVQKELRHIKVSTYNKRTSLDKLVRNLTFDSRHHSRDHESQADSMAVEFLHNTSFNIHESLSTLALLDSVDTDNIDMDVCLKKMFDAPAYPFQKRWLARQTGLLGGHATIQAEDPLVADSLKTHPDCTSRIQFIKPLVARYSSPVQGQFQLDTAQFENTRLLFEYEIIAYAFGSDNYTKSLFYTLSLLQKKPADPYLVTQTGKILNGLYTAQKKHLLGKFIDLPSPGYPANYNILLQFIQNLYLEDYAAISYHFLYQYQPLLSSYASFTAVYNTSIELNKGD